MYKPCKVTISSSNHKRYSEKNNRLGNNQTTIAIFQAIDDVVDDVAYRIQRATICHREINVVIVVKMLVQHVEINVCKGWITVITQLLLLITKDNHSVKLESKLPSQTDVCIAIRQGFPSRILR